MRFTRNQANVIYAAFKRGALHSHFPNKGWVYDYAVASDSKPVQAEQIALANVCSMVFAKKYKEAQQLLDNVFGKYPVLR